MWTMDKSASLPPRDCVLLCSVGSVQSAREDESVMSNGNTYDVTLDMVRYGQHFTGDIKLYDLI